MIRILGLGIRLFVSCALLGVTSRATAIQLLPGYIVSPQNDNSGTVLAIDPATGDRSIFSLYPSVGTGPRMTNPSSIATLPDGNFLVAEQGGAQGVFRIDRNTGNRTFISGIGAGSPGDPGPVGIGPIDNPGAVLLSAVGDIYLVNDGGFNSATGFITKINPTTGVRTLISGLGTGTGPAFATLGSGEIAADGRLFVAGETSIFAVDLATGARSIISGPGVGSGPAFAGALDLAVLPDGNLLTTDFGSSGGLRSALFRVDPATGNRTIIDQHFFPTIGFNYQRVARNPAGDVLGAVDGIYSINPLNGSRTLVSGAGRGIGPAIINWGDMVVVVPEPGTYTLGLMCVAVVAIRRRRKR